MTDAPKTIAEMPALKPCPFCGGEATYRVDHTTEHVDSISCRQCDFYMSDQGIVQGSVRDTWNRRALPLPDDAEMVAARSAAIREFCKAMGLAGSTEAEYLPDDVRAYRMASALSAMRGEP